MVNVKMRVVIALIFFVSSAVVLANPLAETGKYVVADQAYLEKQIKVLDLFYRSLEIDVPNLPPVVKTVDEVIKWLQEHKDWFKKPEIVDMIMEWFTEDYILPASGHFSLVYREHYEQAMGFLKLFYYAKDTDKLFKVANVVVDFINPEMWTWSFSVAIVHRPDMVGIDLPPIYEIQPYYFFNKDVINEFYMYKCNSESDGPFYIKSNYSDHIHHNYDEQSALNYYLEDIGLNSYHYYLNIYHPFFIDGAEIDYAPSHLDKIVFDTAQFLLSRYYLERIANYKGSIPILDWNAHHIIPYHATLEYDNADTFPERPEYVDMHDFYTGHNDVTSEFEYILTHINHIEDKIHSIFHTKLEEDKGVADYHPFHRNVTKLIGSYFKHVEHLLGNSETSFDWKHVIPGVLEHAQTLLRDPVAYSAIKRVFHYFYEYQSHLEPYTKEQLVFPGVEIMKVEVDPLVTYMDTYYSNLSAFSHKFCPHKTNKKIFVEQKRLNHKPFTYKIHLKCNPDVPVVVKVFIGPKHDELGRHINITTNRVNFVPLDIFKWECKAGQSVIKRSSQDSTLYRDDQMPFSVFHEKITNALAGKEEYHIKKEKKYYYFPKRFLLPIGTHHEIPYQMFVYIYKLKFETPDSSGLYIDHYSTFYPFDRHIKYEKQFLYDIPNSHFEDITIRYKTPEDAGVNAVQPPH